MMYSNVLYFVQIAVVAYGKTVKAGSLPQVLTVGLGIQLKSLSMTECEERLF